MNTDLKPAALQSSYICGLLAPTISKNSKESAAKAAISCTNSATNECDTLRRIKVSPLQASFFRKSKRVKSFLVVLKDHTTRQFHYLFFFQDTLPYPHSLYSSRTLFSSLHHSSIPPSCLRRSHLSARCSPNDNTPPTTAVYTTPWLATPEQPVQAHRGPLSSSFSAF